MRSNDETDGGEGPLAGKPLIAFISTHTRAPATRHKHLALVPSITLTSGAASVVSYLVRVDEHDRGYPTVCWFGRYHDRMVRCVDGEWRIKKRRVEMEAGPMAWALLGQQGSVVRASP
ncbi:MAG: nuclear transport factor 2 family protein [Chloroflexi bacterium]|nr:nuclear transport factor 2 family protein [Chloroflexota bacterium]